MDFRSRLPRYTSKRVLSLVGVSKDWMIHIMKHGSTPSVDVAKRIEAASGGEILWTEFFEDHDSPSSGGAA